MSGCGGCIGLGSHKRYCQAVVGARGALLGTTSDQLESCGDLIGASDAYMANRCYDLAASLRAMVERMKSVGNER